MISIYNKIKNYVRKQRALKVIRKKTDTTNMKPEDVICAIPWTHLAFEPSGKVVPCCLTSHHNYFAGDLNKESIEEIWNSDNMKLLRKEMMEGREPKICATCFDKEKVTGESGRIFHNRDFKNVIKIIPEITKPDGTCTEMKLKYWDFRFSNLCNFKCRSCGPRYSSAWVPDAKKLWSNEQEKVWNIESVDDTTNYDFLKDQIQYVEKIYFAGGEPLLMPEHWQILDLLVENQRFDVKVSYNTNCSTLSYGKKNALDYWSKWEPGKLEVWPSIDEIGERAELIRSGTVWPKVEENLIELTKLSNITVRPGITVGAWNVARLPEIIDHLISIGVVTKKHRHENWFINLLQYPEHYHVSILPDDYRKQVVDRLELYIQDYNKKYNTSIDYRFTQILHELKKPHEPKFAKKFLEMSASVDEIRNEDIFKTIPEMKVVRDSVK
jgi:radical SAM protein with 4Fe4S-binding SPASM domain